MDRASGLSAARRWFNSTRRHSKQRQYNMNVNYTAGAAASSVSRIHSDLTWCARLAAVATRFASLGENLAATRTPLAFPFGNEGRPALDFINNCLTVFFCCVNPNNAKHYSPLVTKKTKGPKMLKHLRAVTNGRSHLKDSGRITFTVAEAPKKGKAESGDVPALQR